MPSWKPPSNPGLPKVEDFNTGNNQGVGYFHVNQKRGWRWNTSRRFLKPIENRQNLRVVTGAHTKEGPDQGGQSDWRRV